MLKPSKYNVLYNIDDGEYILVNTLYSKSVKILSKEKIYNLNLNDIPNCKHKFFIDNNFFINDSIDEVCLNEYMMYRKLFNNKNLGLQVILGNKCNFRCSYCWQNHDINNDLSLDSTQSLLRFIERKIQSNQSVYIDWIGGEPLLYSKTINYLSKAIMLLCDKKQKKYLAGITTNGYYLTNDMFKEMVKNRIISYEITIDGTGSIHNRQRYLKNGDGTYNIIKDNILQIVSTKPSYVKIIIRMNVTSELLGLTEDICSSLCGIFKRENVFLKVVKAINPITNETYITDEDFIDFCIKLEQGGLTIMPPISLGFMEMVCSSIDENYYSINGQLELHKCILCSSFGKIDSNGKHLENDIYKMQWINHKKLDKCASCELLPACQAQVCPYAGDKCLLNMAKNNQYGKLIKHSEIINFDNHMQI